ncbi:MAG: hypothetical protein LBU23_07245, partial [Planctomycetota bacterium]|nr:hypothetical protein [Planctomycetota bacterium]
MDFAIQSGNADIALPAREGTMAGQRANLPADELSQRISSAYRQARVRPAPPPVSRPLNPALAEQLRLDEATLMALAPRVGPNAASVAQASLILSRLGNQEIAGADALDRLRELRRQLDAGESGFAESLATLDAVERSVLDQPLLELASLAGGKDAKAINAFAKAIGEWRERLRDAKTSGEARQVADLFRNQVAVFAEAARDISGEQADRLRRDAADAFARLAGIAGQKAAYLELAAKTAAMGGLNDAVRVALAASFDSGTVKAAIETALVAAERAGLDVSAAKDGLVAAGASLNRASAQEILADLKEKFAAAGINRKELAPAIGANRSALDAENSQFSRDDSAFPLDVSLDAAEQGLDGLRADAPERARAEAARLALEHFAANPGASDFPRESLAEIKNGLLLLDLDPGEIDQAADTAEQALIQTCALDLLTEKIPTLLRASIRDDFALPDDFPDSDAFSAALDGASGLRLSLAEEPWGGILADFIEQTTAAFADEVEKMKTSLGGVALELVKEAREL